MQIKDSTVDYYKRQCRLLENELEYYRRQNTIGEQLWANWYDTHIVKNTILARQVMQIFSDRVATNKNTDDAVNIWGDTIAHCRIILTGRLFWVKPDSYDGKTGVKLDVSQPMILKTNSELAFFVNMVDFENKANFVRVDQVDWLRVIE